MDLVFEASVKDSVENFQKHRPNGFARVEQLDNTGCTRLPVQYYPEMECTKTVLGDNYYPERRIMDDGVYRLRGFTG